MENKELINPPSWEQQFENTSIDESPKDWFQIYVDSERNRLIDERNKIEKERNMLLKALIDTLKGPIRTSHLFNN